MNGIVNLLKPPGMSSNGAVVFLRKLTGTKRVGHAGTLDPGASGVLPICMGRCTRLSDRLMNAGKEYIAEVSFGIATDTLDSYGAITARKACKITADALKAAIVDFIGEITQIPPLYSAVKIDGVPSYKLARKGRAVRKPPRTVTIYALEYLSQTGENRFLLRVACSKGTYIRVLLEDIGKALQAPAYMSFLLRSQAGGLSIENAYTIDEIKARYEQGDTSWVMDARFLLSGLAEIRFDGQQAFALTNGVVLPDTIHRGGEYLLYAGEKFLGIGEKADGEVRLKIPLYTPDAEQ